MMIIWKNLLTTRIGLFGYSLIVCVSGTVNKYGIGSLVSMELSTVARTIMVSCSVFRLKLQIHLMVLTSGKISN
ncbi:hypothetical protein B5G16_11675 [Alistipes sp. An66]|nr:hypothetical protein B5G16_11675 [Alistipes sp. An66]